MIVNRVAGDLVYPGSQTFFILEGRQRAMNPHERLLQHVFGYMFVRNSAANEPPQVRTELRPH
jgi:hypothetical protein